MEKRPSLPGNSLEKAPKILRFKSWGEYFDTANREGAFEPKQHVDDIEVEGQMLSSIEKNNIQEQSVALTKNILDNHLAGLGIKGRSLDPKRITFVEYYSLMEAGAWYQDEDWVIVPAYNEGNVGTLVHEGLHATSSQWQYRAAEYMESQPAGTAVKTGFASRRLHNPPRTVFDVLNEAMTEKMTRQITAPHADEIEAINQGSNRKAYYLHAIEETKKVRVEKAQVEAERKIKELADKLPEHIERIKKEREANTEEVVRKWIESGMPQKYIDEYVEDEKKLLEMDIQFENNFFEMKSGFETSSIEMETNKWNVIKAGVEETMNNPTRHDSYQQAIEMLDLILDGVAYKEAKDSGENEETVRQRLWQDMQRAYFEGNVMWLRKIEKTFGDGALEAIATIPHPAVEIFTAQDKKKRSEEVKELLQQAVKEMKQ